MDGLAPLTDTSDLKSGIQQVQSGNFSAVFQMFRQKRSDSFVQGHQSTRYSATDTGNPFVPKFTKDPAGTEVSRQATGMGTFVMDPMTHLEEKVSIDHPYAHIPIGNASDSRQDTVRRKGLSAYKRVNGKSANREYQSGHQL